MFLLSILFAFWCYRELYVFPQKVNQQIFQDCNCLVSLPFSEKEFINQSHLKSKKRKLSYALFIIFPLISLTYNSQIVIGFVLMILFFLSLMDIYYYLTDIFYVLVVFVLSLFHLIFIQEDNMRDYLFSLFSIIVFFITFQFIIKWIYKKEAFGQGDVMLLVAISLFFHIEQMINLLLFSSIIAILYAMILPLIQKDKVKKLPFIPFISLSSWILFTF